MLKSCLFVGSLTFFMEFWILSMKRGRNELVLTNLESTDKDI